MEQTIRPDTSALVDIKDASVDKNLTKEERIAEFIRQIKGLDTRTAPFGDKLNKSDYKQLKDNYEGRIETLREAIGKLRQQMDSVKNNSNERLKWTQHFKRLATMTVLDRRAVIALIQSVRVISKTELKITFRYQMEYEAALAKLARHEEAARLQLLMPAIQFRNDKGGALYPPVRGV